VALAGSAPRGIDETHDRDNAAGLMACAKNRSEHEIVVEELREKLAGVCSELSCPDTPQLRWFPEALHLATLIEGTLESALTAMEVAGVLHPSSAVCGIPSGAALELIEKGEEERGWYSGAVGWMDINGDGSFAVALRSGLFERDRATVWAGAGIVEASQADAEFEETETKMGAIASIIQAC
jgi:isochorismate synthase